MADGRIRLTITVEYDVDLDHYEGCTTIEEACLVDAGQDEDIVFGILEMSEFETKFEAV